MCGISGILFPDPGRSDSEGRLRKMQRALEHRGPDGSGTYLSPMALLAHTRLALVDLEGGVQPMSDVSGRYHLVFNGEIYNHQELRAQLGGYPFRTNSDTETLLAALLEWGEGCLPKLDGMFAFALWDSQLEQALLARDALGVKPLVYGQRDAEFVFASEAKALLAGGWQRRCDEEAIVEYIVAPAFSGVRTSMFEGLEHLPAGHRMRVGRNGAEASRPWFRYQIGREQGPDDNFDSNSDTDATALAARLQKLLRQSVNRSLRADVDVGVFLSGGLDSSLLSYLACESGPAPMAFSLRFEDPSSICYESSSIVISDDAPFVDQVVSQLGMELVHANLSRDEMLKSLPRLAAANDRIVAWEQEFGQDALARATAGRRKAVLVGDAADETHFGYFFLLAKEATQSPGALIERFGAKARCGTLAARLQKEQPLERLDEAYQNIAKAAGASFEGSIDERRRACTALIVRLWLGRLLHNGDTHTMAHGVEARVPFASIELLRFVASISPAQGMENSVEKALLRRAARGVIPDVIATRKKSALPVDPRLGSLYQRELKRLLALEPDFANHFLGVAAVHKLCETVSITETLRSQLFTLLNLLLWKQAHLA
ncbi:MAG: asparagine synthase (glutamine-hydrolyzing) [Kofleriaceae bacterium]|nr:asparagine synthase (glutamine-hydrolyzing) [Kofleriaceae bacterium]